VKTLGRKLGINKTVIKSLQVLDLKNNHDLLPSDSKLSRYRLNRKMELEIKGPLKNRCRRLWHTLVMLNDGSVVPCCFDKNGQHVIGKYPGSSMVDIWKGEPLGSFRQRVLNSRSNIQICCNCSEGTAGTFL
jgi:hypothetical protein